MEELEPLPGGDGFDLVARAGREELAGAVIALVPSGDLAREIDRCRQAGAGYLRKPVKRADLVRALQRVVDPTCVSGALPRPQPRQPAADPGVLSGLRVLVVEDNPFNQKVAAMKLGRWGCRVRVAGSGREAIRALGEETFDVLFTDIQMPDMDGFELTAAVRRGEAETGRRLPVVAMTAHAMKGVRERCLAGGMDDYVSKPIRDEDLLGALRRAAGHAAAETLTPGPQDTPPPAPPPAPPPPETAAFDETAALERVGGNRDMLRSLVEVYDQDCATLTAELVAAVRDGSGVAVRAAAHTIKGMVTFLGADAAADAAVRLERAGELGDLAAGEELLAALLVELERLAAALAPYRQGAPAGPG